VRRTDKRPRWKVSCLTLSEQFRNEWTAHKEWWHQQELGPGARWAPGQGPMGRAMTDTGRWFRINGNALLFQLILPPFHLLFPQGPPAAPGTLPSLPSPGVAKRSPLASKSGPVPPLPDAFHGSPLPSGDKPKPWHPPKLSSILLMTKRLSSWGLRTAHCPGEPQHPRTLWAQLSVGAALGPASRRPSLALPL
jgi:hypothetical protein